jgi:putative ABC transport system substrate-binding protein
VQVKAIQGRDAARIKASIEDFAAEPNGSLLPGPGTFTTITTTEMIRLATQYRLPAVCGLPSFASDGGLMSYASDSFEVYRGVASYVDRLLRGTKVSELPVQYPTRFRLVINLKTAKAIGLNIPASVLARADEVIE